MWKLSHLIIQANVLHSNTYLLNQIIGQFRIMGWNIDTYDGSSVRTDAIYYPIGIPLSAFYIYLLLQLVTLQRLPSYRAAFKLVISTFNQVNSTAVADLTDPELPSAGANPTVAEISTGAGHIVTHINTAIDALPILLPTANMRTGLQTLLQ